MAAPEPFSAGRWVRSRGTRGGTENLLSREVGFRATGGSTGALLGMKVGFGATGDIAAPEPSSVGRRGLEPQDTWRHRSPSQQGGRVQSYGTRGNIEILINREARSEAVGHVVACGSTSYSLPWSHTCIWGYPICRVLT
jgi:hypothetical protein